MILQALIPIALLLAAAAAFAQTPPKSDAEVKLHALFEEDWQWGLARYPESATYLGDNRYNNRLTDLSFEAIEREKAHEREMLERIQKIERAGLSGQDVISYDLFLYNKRREVEGHRFFTELMPINQMSGLQIGFPQLIGATPFRNLKDYDDYLERLAALPKYIDQAIALMERGVETGWVYPATPLKSVPTQIEGQIVDDVEASLYYSPFKRMRESVSPADGERLRKEARRLIAASVFPSLGKLSKFIKEKYLPAGRRQVGAGSLPDGEAYYAYAVRRMTTTDFTPLQIHETGRRETARIRAEMETVIGKTGFQGSFQDFLDYLRKDARFYFTRAEDLVSAYRDIAKRADPLLTDLFAELPRNPYGVREIPAYEAPAQAAAYYQPGAPDGTRAGYFWVNTHKLETRPKYEMEALALHEAVPGHHLQISRAQELKGLPNFRRHGGYTAYIEGWGLYAEGLGEEMGFYADPYSKFGQLNLQMWRACRLVVDTGLHALGWTRDQAIDFMKENLGKAENEIIVEIDRYLVLPAQALTYMMGELQLRELRARAEKELGDRFDVRKFHNALLDDGPLPLGLLKRRIEAWIAGQIGS